MLDILQKAAALIFVLGVLIAFHEFGHFWVARKLGVKVLRFSVGFGKPLLRYQANADSPEYMLAALPLGGYVKMLDEREGEVADDELHLAFNRQSVWKRIAIVAAGPVFNLVLAVILFALMYVMGINALKPVLDEPGVNTAAYVAGVRAQDQVLAVNGNSVQSWSDFNMAMIDATISDPRVVLTLAPVESLSGSVTREAQLDTAAVNLLADKASIADLGLTLHQPQQAAIVGDVVSDSGAEAAGIQAGDEILSIEDKVIKGWGDIVDAVSDRANQTLAVTVLREGRELALSVTTQAREVNGKSVAVLGIQSQRLEHPYLFKAKYEVWESLQLGWTKTVDTSVLVIKTMVQLITGQASIKNISGPITIADYAGKSAKIGLAYLIGLMAGVSVSLGILNLMPVPILDGGHLLYYMVELVKGSPVSERVMLIGQQFGLAVLLMLMSLAFYNDINRIIG